MLKKRNLLLFILYFSINASSAVLDEVQFHPGQRVGLYTGTFDPIHRGHLDLIDISLELGLDYIIVVPNDWALHKPEVSPTPVRMIEVFEQFQYSPNVLVLRPNKTGIIPNFIKVISLLSQSQHTSVQLIALMGDDVFESKKIQLFWWLIYPKIKEYWIFNRNKSVPMTNNFHGIRLKHVQRERAQLSSTQVRELLADLIEKKYISEEEWKKLSSNVPLHIVRKRLSEASWNNLYSCESSLNL